MGEKGQHPGERLVQKLERKSEAKNKQPILNFPLAFRLPPPSSSLGGSVFGLVPPTPPRPRELDCWAPAPPGDPTLPRGFAKPIVDLAGVARNHIGKS